MRKWDGMQPVPCWPFQEGSHLLVASRGGWSFLCAEKPERWQDMEGNPADIPLIIPNSDTPTCAVCKMILEQNEKTPMVKDNWPIEWREVKIAP